MDYSQTDNGDGTFTWNGGLPEYVYDPSVQKYVPYFIEQDANSIILHSKQYPLIFDKNECSISVYDNSFSQIYSNTPKVIGKEYWNVAYAPTGSSSWIELDSLSIPCIFVTSSDPNGISLTVTRSAPLKGELIVTYYKPNDQPLKISATFENLNPSWTSHKFRFVEKFVDVSFSDVDLEGSKLSNFGGFYSNFFNYDSIPNKLITFGKTNLKPFVVNVEQGWDDFQGVNVNFANSKLDIDFVYGRGLNLLLPSQIMTIDPTYGFTTGNNYHVSTSASTGTSCPSPNTTGTANRVLIPTSSNNSDCRLIATEWDITSITDGATVTDTNIRFTPSSLQNARNCDYWSMESQPSTLGATDLWNDILNGTEFVNNDSGCTSATLQTLDLGASADTDVEDNLGVDWWGVGMSYNDMTRDSQQHRIDRTSVELEVVYTTGSTSHSYNATDSSVSDESYSTMTSNTITVTDQSVSDESYSTMTSNTITVTDQSVSDESTSVNSSINVTVTDQSVSDESYSTMTSNTITVTDQSVSDESFVAFNDSVVVTDQSVSDESFTVNVKSPIFNAVKFYLNTPELNRLGGVFALSCTTDKVVVGLNQTGLVTCQTLPLPTSSSLGGVKSLTCGGTDFVKGLDTNGDLICQTP